MNKQRPKNTYYDLQEILGEGVTSQVYRAFRVDQKTQTRQQIALKIIKSEKDVQILKREFTKLLQVQSKYCVQVHGWENLPKGPAIVMELIEGVTLHELFLEKELEMALVDELYCQIGMGLRSLHRSGVVHGDLNLKNILINSEGVVKLIDFGFFGEGKVLMTPKFTSPAVVSGEAPSEKSDFYSLDKICDHLQRSFSEVRLVSKGTSKASRRRLLSQLVKERLAKTSQKTQIIKFTSSSQRKVFGPLLIAITLFLYFLVFPMLFVEDPVYGTLDVKGRKWIKVSINGLPGVYGPIVNKKLRRGAYRLRWTTAEKDKINIVSIKEGQTFRLNP